MRKILLNLMISLLGKDRAINFAECIYNSITGEWIEDLEQHSEELDRYRRKYGWL